MYVFTYAYMYICKMYILCTHSPYLHYVQYLNILRPNTLTYLGPQARANGTHTVRCENILHYIAVYTSATCLFYIRVSDPLCILGSQTRYAALHCCLHICNVSETLIYTIRRASANVTHVGGCENRGLALVYALLSPRARRRLHYSTAFPPHITLTRIF